MATNTFDALMAEVNKSISDATAATSEANAASVKANEQAAAASSAAQAADAAAEAANDAADAANSEADAWENAEITAETLSEGSAATVTVSEADGKKNIAFGIPRGATGKAGLTGPAGKSGVTFSLSGTKLYITTG